MRLQNKKIVLFLFGFILAIGLFFLVNPKANIPSLATNNNCSLQCVKRVFHICIDYDYVCTNPSPTPTASPTPTSEPTQTPTPLPTNVPTLTPTPTAGQPIKDEDRNDNCSRNPAHPNCQQQASAPVCQDGTVLELPANSHVVRFEGTAVVKWVPTGGSLVDIYYRENDQSGWVHAAGDLPNHGYVVITELRPELGYTFGIRQHNGCGGGETVIAVIIDPPAHNPTLFPFSYWEWF